MSPSTDEQPAQAEDSMKLQCPNRRCKSDCIGQVDLVPGLAMIDSVDADGTINWSGSTEIDWNGQRSAHKKPRYQCEKCGYLAKGLDSFLVRPDKGKVSKSKARKSKSEKA